MTLNQLAKDAYDNAVAHGFYLKPPSIDRRLMLIVSELAEAQNELRDDRDPTDVYYRENDNKPEGFGIELADAIIRIVDLAESLHLDIGALVAEKHAFNVTRPFKHGRAF
jgi:NTP pyrophosphatase (non-canonical NTP hydrolase)